MDELNGKTAVVTGAASGIGLAIAEALGAAGMQVMLADIEDGALKDAAQQLADAGVACDHHVVDVADADAVDGLRDATIDRFGGVHVVVNNAGVGGINGTAWEQSRDAWRWVLDVNLGGVINGVRSFAPVLAAQGEGHIVNTASAAGLAALPGMAPYSTSKFAVVGLSETLLHDFAGVAPGVGVSVLCPMFVRTAIHDSERNAPAALKAEIVYDDAAMAMKSFMQAMVESGIEPSEVAAQTVDAIRQHRFWVITHPDVLPMIEDRARRVVAGDAPLNPFG